MPWWNILYLTFTQAVSTRCRLETNAEGSQPSEIPRREVARGSLPGKAQKWIFTILKIHFCVFV